jgi:hypothetical protein
MMYRFGLAAAIGLLLAAYSATQPALAAVDQPAPATVAQSAPSAAATPAPAEAPGASAAQTGPAVPAPAFMPAPSMGNLYLDLDIVDGRYSEWRINDLGTINALRARLQVHRFGEQSKWAPTFTIEVDRSNNENVQFQLTAPRRGSPLVIRAVHRAGSKFMQFALFHATLNLDQKLDIAIDWTPTGDITLRIAPNEFATMALHGAPTKLSIGASTGEIEFDPLALGHSGP